MHLQDSEVDVACHYIRRQMDAHSWWPKAQPREAQREFELMCGTALSLNVWCDRWLDEGQCKKLEKSVRG
ncbi:MAG: hypothetical protein HOO93_03810 [Methyloglobulus sp.]|nr:hypothetical protein [Methyloglobulus sp.]